DKGKAHLPGHGVGQLLAVQLVELGLGVEEVNLTGSAFQVNADTGLGPGREVWRPGGQRVERVGRFALGGAPSGVLGRRRQGHKADAAGGGGEEVAAGVEEGFLKRVHLRFSCYSRVTNSSRFMIVRASATHAAASAVFPAAPFPLPSSWAAFSGCFWHICSR